MKLNTLILGLAACSTAASQEPPTDAKPDLLFICFDQLSALALGEGNTPTIDALAARGSSFTAVVTCPLCIPSRASFWSGLLPHRTGIVNGSPQKPTSPWPADRPAMGRALSAAGYTCTHLGKTHDVGSLDGFTRGPMREEPTEPTHPAWPLAHDSRRDALTLREALASLAAPPSSGPRCLAIDLCNPHDICNWIGSYHAGTCRVDPPVPLPALRPNHAADDPATLPRPLQYLCCEHSRQAQTTGYSDTDWQRYLAAYHHYQRRSDAALASILAALESSGRAGRTIIVLWADHGDMMGAHGLATKAIGFYEETVRVPLIVAGPGVPAGMRIDGTLASLADLLPTVCGLIGVEAPPCDGLDLSGWLGSARPRQVRTVAACEWESGSGGSNTGRMLRETRWKYAHYLEGDGEQLFDLAADPGEQRNLAHDPAHAGELARMRAALDAHLVATADPYRNLVPKVDPARRAHAPGVRNHPMAKPQTAAAE